MDWPTACVTMSVIAALVIAYAVARLANSSIMSSIDRLHVRVANLEERLNGLSYRVGDLERKKQ
jgi:hypothetical protein